MDKVVGVTRLAVGFMAAACFGATLAKADAVEDFYKGKTVEMYIGTPAGGGYDQYGRLIASYIGRYIPGNPTVVVRNMPGAGHLTMTNHVYNNAPRDGTVLAIPQQIMAVEQAMGTNAGVRYDASKFNWIGRAVSVVTIAYTWHTSPTKTIEDARARETLMGTTGASSPTNIFLRSLNDFAGTKLKLISGYAGTNESELAMQRGEVEGVLADWTSFKVRGANWIKENKVNILVQWARERAPDLPHVRLVQEVGRDDRNSQILQFYGMGNALGRAFMTTPDVPADRLAALREAFQKTLKDPDLVDFAKKSNIDIGPTATGPELHKLIDETLHFSPDIVNEARKGLAAGGG
jgi:tripartite-type tricarboxylate transporter receptor subunit TctC